MLEHGDDTLARCATTGREDDGDDASMDARSRVCSAWGHLTRERGDVRGADEALATARARARSVEDCASANAMWATHAARRKPSERDWASIDAALREGESRAERKGTDGTMVALVGARTLAALTRFRSEEALEAAERCDALIRGTASETLESAQSSAHGWAIASAMKALGHVERLRGSSERAVDFYERALAYATAVTKNESPGAMASNIIAADIKVDACLALSQMYATMDAISEAEMFAARAVSEAEALGDEKHPRVGVCIAASGDVYVAKALRSSVNAAEGELGDGAGIMFAEGLYKSALKLMHYPHIVEDADIVLDYEARHLCALLHARYSSILRASGPQRAREADAWLMSAKILWPDERCGDANTGGVDGNETMTDAATKLGIKNAPKVFIDLQQMAPLTAHSAA